MDILVKILCNSIIMDKLFDIEKKNQEYDELSPRERISDAQERFGKHLGISFSGAEDVVLIDMAVKNNAPFTIFCLDTGRLHQETYNFIDRVRMKYKVDIQIFVPDWKLLEPFVHQYGMNSFYKNGHTECCAIRKVEPLSRALADRSAWITGVRRDQNPDTRSNMAYIELDSLHRDSSSNPLVKINPLLDWTLDNVWTYIRENKVPYNALHDRGFKSIGCVPCTRPSRPGEHERMARWWWEDSIKRECGLHIK